MGILHTCPLRRTPGRLSQSTLGLGLALGRVVVSSCGSGSIRRVATMRILAKHAASGVRGIEQEVGLMSLGSRDLDPQ